VRTIRRFLAPVIGWALIAVIAIPVVQYVIRRNDPNAKLVGLCVDETRKTHPGAWDNHIVAFIAPSPLGSGASFTFREMSTGQVWETQCRFDGSGNLVSAITEPSKQ
jgi:hypothetical protein